MALTPLARLGTFLFPHKTHRVSAPAPASPHEYPKRRAAIALSDSPPRCRRRLSFVDTESITPRPTVTISPLLITAAANLSATSAATEWHALTTIAAATPGPHPGLQDAELRSPFAALFAGTPSADVVVAAISALDAVQAHAAGPLAKGDAALVAGVLRAAGTHAGSCNVTEAVAQLVGHDDWSRVFPDVLAAAASQLGPALLRVLADPGLEPVTWAAALQLLADVADARRRVGGDNDTGLMGRNGARVVVASFERVADRDVRRAETGLRALMGLVREQVECKAFVEENAAAVVSEVSSAFLQHDSVQHACIDVLVKLASPGECVSKQDG